MKKKTQLNNYLNQETIVIGWKSHTYYNRSRVEGIGWKPWPDDYNKAITEDIRMNATKKEKAIFDKFWKFCEEPRVKVSFHIQVLFLNN